MGRSGDGARSRARCRETYHKGDTRKLLATQITLRPLVMHVHASSLQSRPPCA